MIFEIVCSLILVVFVSVILTKYHHRQRPPGPFQWPILGNLVQMAMSKSKLPHVALSDLAEEYGDVMSFKLGVHDAVVLSSLEAMKQMLVLEEFSTSRYPFPFVHDRADNKDLGIVWGVGSTWKEIRKFSARSLRDLGFGKAKSMEAVMSEELDELIKYLKTLLAKTNDSVIKMEDFFTISVINVLWSFMSGIRFKLDDPELAYKVDISNRLNRTATVDNVMILYPVVRYIFPNATGWNEQLKLIKENKDFLKKFIVRHRENLRKSDNTEDPQNFIEAFLLEIDKSKNIPGTSFTDDQLVIVLSDLFIAGSDTTSKTLSFGILYMLLNPTVQKKVWEEVSSVIPKGQFPSMDDADKMPYTKATLLEIARMGGVVPIPPCRQVNADFTYKNYKLPKGLLVMHNMYPVFMDKKYWGDPEVFRPERFLSKTGQLENTERVVPFGFGSRICFGESLSKSTTFLYFTTMIQHFEFLRDPNTPEPCTEPIASLVVGPKPFYVKIRARE